VKKNLNKNVKKNVKNGNSMDVRNEGAKDVNVNVKSVRNLVYVRNVEYARCVKNVK
jgi:hypothetical protein